MPRTRRRLSVGLLLALSTQLAHAPPRNLLALEGRTPSELEVTTLNVWHGLRPMVALRLPGEDGARTERRIELQLRELHSLAPDLLLLQEVNPAAGLAQRYAAALGLDEIHLVASCGLALGPISVPTNIESGLAILARRELGLRRIRAVRLSGPPGCLGDHLGAQLGEARFALLASIRLAGRSVLVATAHLHAGGSGSTRLRQGIEGLVARGEIDRSERRRLIEALARHERRREREAGRLVAAIEHALSRLPGPSGGVIVGGDLNAEPDSTVLAKLAAAGFSPHLPSSGHRALPTWDPVANHANIASGTRPRSRLLRASSPPELIALLDEDRARSRTIDYLLSAGAITGARPRIVLDRAVGGLHPSDHFGVSVLFRPAPDGD